MTCKTEIACGRCKKTLLSSEELTQNVLLCTSKDPSDACLHFFGTSASIYHGSEWKSFTGFREMYLMPQVSFSDKLYYKVTCQCLNAVGILKVVPGIINSIFAVLKFSRVGRDVQIVGEDEEDKEIENREDQDDKDQKKTDDGKKYV